MVEKSCICKDFFNSYLMWFPLYKQFFICLYADKNKNSIYKPFRILHFSMKNITGGLHFHIFMSRDAMWHDVTRWRVSMSLVASSRLISKACFILWTQPYPTDRQVDSWRTDWPIKEESKFSLYILILLFISCLC